MINKLSHSIILTLVLLTVTSAILISASGNWAQAEDDVLSLEDMTNQTAETAGYDSDTDEYSLAKLMGLIAKMFLSLLGVLFISYTIYGGFLWMTAAGNEEKVTKAKTIIRQGMIGLIIILSAAAIYLFISSFLIEGSSSSNLGGSSGT